MNEEYSVTEAGRKRRKEEAPAKAKAEAERTEGLLKQLLGKSPMRLFRERMEREGRGDAYKARWKELRGTGVNASATGAAVRKEFGYQGPRAERELLEQAMNEIRISGVDAKNSAATKKVKRKQREQTFEEAFASFPQTAPIEIDMAWVQSHPAMFRFERQILGESGKPDPVLIDVRDLFDVNGPAPSKRAINILQNWVNRAPIFFKDILQDHKKHTSVASNGGVIQTEAVKDKTTDIDRYIDQIGTDANNSVL